MDNMITSAVSAKYTVALRVMMQGMSIISNVEAQFLTYNLNV